MSLGTKSYEYPIVGHHLMWAIGDVLGEAVTPILPPHGMRSTGSSAVSSSPRKAKLYALGGTDPERPWRKYRVVERLDESRNFLADPRAR